MFRRRDIIIIVVAVGVGPDIPKGQRVLVSNDEDTTVTKTIAIGIRVPSHIRTQRYRRQ
ncbi:MAG: hypothetical protein ACJAZO_005300 [Myxococcota bacterium]